MSPPDSERAGAAHTKAAPELLLAGWGLLLNAAWELAQSPLYADHTSGLGYVLRTRLHCAGGDLLILSGAWAVTTLIAGGRGWLQQRPGWPAVLCVGLGLAYTGWSEWFNTGVASGWSYAPAMPRLLGIGISPLLQWLLIPPFLLWLGWKRYGRATGGKMTLPGLHSPTDGAPSH